MLIEPLSPVIVVAARSNRIVVRPWTAHDEEAMQHADSNPLLRAEADDRNPAVTSKIDQIEREAATPFDGDENGDRLDFEIPDDYTQSSGM